jgi:hypothetical protein
MNPQTTNSPSLPPAARSIRDAVIAAIGNAGWSALSDADRILVEACAVDAAALQIALLTAADDAAAAAQVRREKAHVDAQLASLAAAQGRVIAAAIWDAAAKALRIAGAAIAAT